MLQKVDVVADNAMKLFIAPSSSLTSTSSSISSSSSVLGAFNPSINKTVTSSSRTMRSPVSRRQPFFGTSLKDLLLDEHHSHCSHLNPIVGIPRLAHAMISFIHKHIDTKGLFRIAPSSSSELLALKQCIDEDGVFPSNTSVAAVTTLFIQVKSLYKDG